MGLLGVNSFCVGRGDLAVCGEDAMRREGEREGREREGGREGGRGRGREGGREGGRGRGKEERD